MAAIVFFYRYNYDFLVILYAVQLNVKEFPFGFTA
jgi:hypothetical protein